MKNNKVLLVGLSIILLLGIYSMFKTPILYSYFENRNLEEKPSFYFKDYLSGTFQDSIEKAISDQFIGSQIIRIHYKEYTNLIDIFNVDKLICKNNYLAYDDKTYTFNCKNKLIKKYSSKEEAISTIKNKSKMYNYINNKYDVYYYFINDSNTYDFKSNKETINFKDIINNEFTGNYHIEELAINSWKDYKKEFYNSDHHWNGYGSYEGYKGIIKMFYPDDEIVKPTGTYEAKNYKFYGSNSKQVRKIDCYDKFSTYTFDLGDYTTIINRKNMEYGNSKEILSSKNYKYPEYDNLYATYYGTDYGEIIFDFDNPDKDNLLVLSSSYSNPLNKLLASHFNKTYIVDLRHYENSLGIKFDIDKYMEENNIDKILVLGNYPYFQSDEFDFKVGDE